MSGPAGMGLVGRLTVTVAAGACLAVALTIGLPVRRGPASHTGAGGAAGESQPTGFHPPSALAESPRVTCIECHPGLPHARSSTSRAILNAHAARIHCLVCHGTAGSAGEARLREGVLVPLRGGKTLDAAAERSLREAAMRGGKCLPAGFGCAVCHHSAGVPPLAGWGYPAERVARLTTLESFFFLAREQRWFFPAFK